jgi:nitrate/nitrite transport system substrate-binding protein
VISRPAYINTPAGVILDRMQGKYDYGDGKVEQDPNYIIFSQRECNFPQKTFGLWWLTQFRRWGMVKAAPDYQGIVKRVVRQDIFLEAMKEMNVAGKFQDMQKQTLMDGVFDPAEPEKYALSFPVHTRS